MSDRRESALWFFLLGLVVGVLVVGGGMAGWIAQRRARANVEIQSARHKQAALVAGAVEGFEAARRDADEAERRADAAEAALKAAEKKR